MKTILVHRSIHLDTRLANQVRDNLRKLAELARIQVAEVSFERSAAASPPFLVRMRLAVPGPDLCVEEKEHTLQAALHKAFGKLSRMVRSRKEFLKSKRKSELKVPHLWTKSHQPLSFQGA